MSERPPQRDRSLARPAVVLALGVLIANDHVFKQQFPGWITGKLSDAAGLFVLGALLAWILPRWVPAALAVAGVGFAFWKSELSTPLIAAWNQIGVWPVGRTVDLTDLLALPCLVLGARTVLGRPIEGPEQTPRRRRGDVAVALVSLVAFAATSPPLYTFKLRDHGGPRTVIYAGTVSELGTVLEACGIDFDSEEENGRVGVYVAPEPRGYGIHLEGALRLTQGRTVLIFKEGSATFDPADDPTIIDHSILAIETCLDPPEIELPTAETHPMD